MSDANTELLAQMAKALGDLRERMVFGGGCATALLIFGLSRRCAFLLRSLGRSGIVDTVTISYNGEQWRNGGNTAVQILAFSYEVSSTPFTSPIDTAAEPNGGWTGFAAACCLRLPGPWRFIVAPQTRPSRPRS